MTWIQDPKGTRVLSVKDAREVGKRGVSATIGATAPVSIESFGLFGAYRYVTEDVDCSAILDRDIVPIQSAAGEVTLPVLWSGEPVPGCKKVSTRGPTQLSLETDSAGNVTFAPAEPSLHSVLAVLDDDTPGTDPVDGKDGIKARHQSTLVIPLLVNWGGRHQRGHKDC